MAVTNEFERDLTNQAQLKRPGRVDLIVFQNVADAGDGSPGIQRCFRNYLHEGGMEKDLQLIGFGIKGTSVDINNAELQQLSNIGASVITSGIWTQLDNIEATTISPTQWGYVGGADQNVRTSDSPTFGGLALTGNLTIAANSITGTNVNINNAEMQQLSNIGAAEISGIQWGYLGGDDQALKQADSPTFSGLTLSTGGVITSEDDDLDFTFGRLKMGSLWADSMAIAYRGMFTTANYALRQLAAGETSINAPTGSNVVSRINGSTKMSLNNTTLTMSVPIAMGANNITLNASQTVDGIDISAIKLNSMPTAADGDIDASTQKIINVADPENDQDAATKKYAKHGVASDNLVFSNDVIVYPITNASYQKKKEIICHRSGYVRVYFEHRTAVGGPDSVMSRIYINGIAVGTERETLSSSYVGYSEDFEINNGDLIQVYSKRVGTADSMRVQYFRILFDDFESNDP